MDHNRTELDGLHKRLSTLEGLFEALGRQVKDMGKDLKKWSLIGGFVSGLTVAGAHHLVGCTPAELQTADKAAEIALKGTDYLCLADKHAAMLLPNLDDHGVVQAACAIDAALAPKAEAFLQRIDSAKISDSGKE